MLMVGCGVSSSVYATIIYRCCYLLGWQFIAQKVFLFLFLSLFMEIVFCGIARLFMKISHPITYYGVFSVLLSGYVSFAIPTGKEGVEAIIDIMYLFIIFQVLFFSGGVIGFSTLFKNRSKTEGSF
jgi:hypothetical protein